MALSLRNALNAQGIKGCPNGLLALNPFYGTSSAARKSFGFTKLSQVINSLRWPVGFTALKDWPADQDQVWNNDAEGMAHDDATWFFTNARKQSSDESSLMTVPISTDLQGLSNDHFEQATFTPMGDGGVYPISTLGDIIKIPVMAGYNHIGALTLQTRENDSILYLPIQDNDGSNPPIIYALQSVPGQSIVDHRWGAIIPQPVDDQGAWCAFDPIGLRLYTSNFCFHGTPPSSSVDVYTVGSPSEKDIGSPVIGEPFILNFIGTIRLFEADGETPVTMNCIQSGFITQNRHLYLAVDDGTGLVGFDLITCRKRAAITVDYQPWHSGLDPAYQELEGCCLFSNPSAPGMSGDIHLQVIENMADDFWIKHYGVKDPEDRPFI